MFIFFEKLKREKWQTSNIFPHHCYFFIPCAQAEWKTGITNSSVGRRSQVLKFEEQFHKTAQNKYNFWTLVSLFNSILAMPAFLKPSGILFINICIRQEESIQIWGMCAQSITNWAQFFGIIRYSRLHMWRLRKIGIENHHKKVHSLQI